MGLFQQRPEEHTLEWAGLPSEPRDAKETVEVLPAASDIDPSAVSFSPTQTIVFPVAAPTPEAADASEADPGEDAGA